MNVLQTHCNIKGIVELDVLRQGASRNINMSKAGAQKKQNPHIEATAIRETLNCQFGWNHYTKGFPANSTSDRFSTVAWPSTFLEER